MLLFDQYLTHLPVVKQVITKSIDENQGIFKKQKQNRGLNRDFMVYVYLGEHS